VLVILEIGSHFYAQTSLDCNPPMYASLVGGITGVHHHAQRLLVEMGGWSLETFCKCWPGTVALLISISWIARITGVSHHIRNDWHISLSVMSWKFLHGIARLRFFFLIKSV
jgi:hypothetical protein